MSPSGFLGSKLLRKGVALPFNFLSPSNRPRPSPAQPTHPAGSVDSGTPVLTERAPPASRPRRRVWCLETQHPRQGDLGPQCARPDGEHPPSPRKLPHPQAVLWPQVPPRAGPTLPGPTWVVRAQAPDPAARGWQVPGRGSGCTWLLTGASGTRSRLWVCIYFPLGRTPFLFYSNGLPTFTH